MTVYYKQICWRCTTAEVFNSEHTTIAVPIIFSAAGDSGKGMMTLDLAMKVSSGQPMSEAFGGHISEFGNSIIFTAEDDESEMHRRIERLDYDNNRSSYEHELRIVSLPNVGGVFLYYKKHMMAIKPV
jgi:RecA-family ATPase